MPRRAPLSKVGVFAMDPGGKTGLAWAVADLSLPNTRTILQNLTLKDSITVEGDEYQQIKEISQHWMKFFRDAVKEAGIHFKRVDFVSEDFIPRPSSHQQAPGKEGISPVRILWGVEGYRLGRADEWQQRRRTKQRRLVSIPRVILQHPSQAAGFGTSDRLRDWDLWVVGKEHERAAWKHVALRVATLRDIRQKQGVKSK